MLLPGSADCADSFSILVPDNESTKQFCLGLWTEFELTLEKSRYFDEMSNKNYQIAKQSEILPSLSVFYGLSYRCHRGMTRPLAISLTDNNIFTHKFLLLFIFETPELLIWVVYEET